MTKIEKEFKKPNPQYRSAPFWAWNDELNDTYLHRQLDEMKKGGMAGGFIHSRIGLITPYLSKEWMEKVRSAVKYAKKIGIPIYLYDEDRWPSGFAGGFITKNKKYAMKMVKITKLTSNRWNFKKITLPPSESFNNSSYLDTLNSEAVGEFIKSTYAAYRKVVGNEFNRTIPAIFTDEPSYLRWWVKRGEKDFYLPWTDGLAELFKKRYGYDIREKFIYLVENKGDYKKVRYDFTKLALELFLNNFGRQIYDWCEENNIALTGHYLEEDTLASQIRVLGAAMPFYEYMQMPGIDHLYKQIESVHLTIKQCSSVAHQLGKERVLSELFGGSGQNMTFTDRKLIGNWDTVLGINLFCPHIWLYSMAGCRKRDYPPTISYQQPYWKYNRVIEDYFARVNFVTNQGKFYCDILLIHPIESAWCEYNPAATKPVERLNDDFVSILKMLSGQHYDYDLGDESLISKYSRVDCSSFSDGRIVSRPQFRIGKMGYSLVVIPHVVSLRETTIDLLNSFIDMGGKVIGFEPIPDRVDGQKDDQGVLKQLYSKMSLLPALGFPSGRKKIGKGLDKSLVSSIAKFIKKDISICGVGRHVEIEDIYCQHRVVGDNMDIYFLVNNSKEKSCSVNIKIAAKKESVLEIWDPVTGNISVLDEVSPSFCGLKFKDGYWSVCLCFPGAGSYIIVRKDIKKHQKSGLSGHRTSRKVPGAASLMQNFAISQSAQSELVMELPVSNWTCIRKNLNSITLDYCQYKAGSMKKWSKLAYVLDIQNILEKKLRRGAFFSIRYFFKAKLNRRPEPVFLVMERPEQYEIRVNNRKVACTDTGFWIDIAFRKIDITSYLRLDGQNTIELRNRFIRPKKDKTLIYVRGGTEIESVYLAGNFCVDGKFRPSGEGLVGKEFVVVDAKEPVAFDTVTSGYPFYAGEFVFSQEFDWLAGKPAGRRVFLSLSEPRAVTLKVTINRKETGLILWPPYCLDITDFLSKGRNLIEMEIIGSLRNLLGPHHQKPVNPVIVGPHSFNDKKSWIPDYTLMPSGLSKSIFFSSLSLTV